MKTYIAQRPKDDEIGDCRVTVQEADGSAHPLHHVKLHSDGFEWGYGGSGPADLALSILADHLGERPTRQELFHGDCRCWGYHQRFKWELISPAPLTGFTLTSDQIAEWLQQQQKES